MSGDWRVQLGMATIKVNNVHTIRTGLNLKVIQDSSTKHIIEISIL